MSEYGQDKSIRGSILTNGTIVVLVVGLDTYDSKFQTVNLKTGRIRDKKMLEMPLRNKYPIYVGHMGEYRWL